MYAKELIRWLLTVNIFWIENALNTDDLSNSSYLLNIVINRNDNDVK